MNDHCRHHYDRLARFSAPQRQSEERQGERLRRLERGLLCAALVVAPLGPFEPAQGVESMNLYNNALLVPYALYTSDGHSTATNVYSLDEGRVYWSFFDADGERRARGDFYLEEKRGYSFIWAAEAQDDDNDVDGDLTDRAGYLIFAQDTNDDERITESDRNGLNGSSFFIELNNRDVAYLPTVPFTAGNLRESDPDDWDERPIDRLTLYQGVDLPLVLFGVAESDDEVALRYLIDGLVGGNDTEIVLWSNRDVEDDLEAEAINDATGERKAVDITIRQRHLNRIDLETLIGPSDRLLDGGGAGYLEFAVPEEDDDGDTLQLIAFALIKSSAIGARQTIMGYVVRFQ